MSVKPIEIDYDKLAEAIIKAHKKIEEETEEQNSKAMKELQEAVGKKEIQGHCIKQFLNDAAIFFRLLFVKQKYIKTSGFVYALIQLFTSSLFAIVQVVLYVLTCCFAFYAVQNIVLGNNWCSFGPFLLYTCSSFIFAQIFRIARCEIMNMKNKKEILAISSAIAAIVAAIVAIIALLIEVT